MRCAAAIAARERRGSASAPVDVGQHMLKQGVGGILGRYVAILGQRA